MLEIYVLRNRCFGIFKNFSTDSIKISRNEPRNGCFLKPSRSFPNEKRKTETNVYLKHIIINAKQCQSCRLRSANHINQSISNTTNLRMLNLKLNKHNKHNLNSVNLYFKPLFNEPFIIYFM